MNILEINLLLIILYAFIFLFIIRSKFTATLFLIITTIQLTIINGLRDISIGVDTIRYYKRFIEIVNNKHFILLEKESGYNFFQLIIVYFTDNFNIWLLVTSSFMFISLAIIVYKYSKRYFISYLLYLSLGFYFFSFNGLRQSIAIILVLLTYKYILNKNFIKFLLIMVLAISIHTSAIIFLPMYFIAHIKWNKLYVSILGGLLVIFYFFRIQIGELLTIIYYDDASWVFEKYNVTTEIGGLAIMILLIIIIGFIIYSPNKFPSLENTVLSNIMIISLFIQLLSSFSYLFTRLNMYFLVFIILYIPFLLDNLGKGSIKLDKKSALFMEIVGKIILIVLLIIYYLNSVKIDGFQILPYKFFWE